MNKRLKMFPVVLMLSTGAITGIITYTLHYEGRTALLIMLGVLLFFYITGSLLAYLINRFEKEQDEKERKRLDEEGKVREKELAEQAAREAMEEKKEKEDPSDAPTDAD